MPAYTFPPAWPHGTLVEVLPDVFVVTGTMKFPGPVPMAASRNMTVVRQGGALVLINSVRLDEPGLQALDALGKVEHVLRLAAFHGSDDPFYKDRYGATVWAGRGQTYAKGFGLKPPPEAWYFRADRELDATTVLPLPGKIHAFPSTPNGEVLLWLDRDGGVVVAGDALQNWAAADVYFNWVARLAMRGMGFLVPHNVGPGWLKRVKPDPAELTAILDLEFQHLLPSHGVPVIGDARERYRPAITAAAAWAAQNRPQPRA
ncbi:MAG: hypothetical protein ABMB14_41280 [Myxococcota bacterium]